MSEWWTYSLSDFLLFSPRTYYRLFELYNADIWPIQILTVMLGGAILALIRWNGVWQGRAVAAILAMCWIWIAWAFHAERYATINWAATYIAMLFVAEGLALLVVGAIRSPLRLRPSGSVVNRGGLCLFVFALLLQPAIGPLVGRTWMQAEIFGVAPDPTAVATLGVALMADRVVRNIMVVPLVWCVVSGATLWTMEAPDAFVMPVAALLGIGLLIWKAWTLRRSRRAAGIAPV